MMFDVYSEINVRYILKYVMYVPVVTTNNQLFSRNLISHQALIPPRYIVAVSFIGGRNRKTLRKPPTCRKSLTNFIT
jgi:hypothetical protein